MDEKDDRLGKFERALGAPPEVAKFAPKTPKPEPTIASLIEQVRQHTQSINELCTDIDRVIADTEASARKAADSLIEASKRMK
jgi:hypothetical protein